MDDFRFIRDHPFEELFDRSREPSDHDDGAEHHYKQEHSGYRRTDCIQQLSLLQAYLFCIFFT